MTTIVHFVLRHGYPIVFAAVFARQIGLPVPAPGFLLAAGALAASGRLGLVTSLFLAVLGCVLADWIWYEAGREWGEKVLQLIHRFAPDPETADRRSRKMFARHGTPLLVLDKFIPGVDAVVPPLAGISGIGRIHFLAFETVGAALWSSAYTGLGYCLSHDLDRAVAYIGQAGRWLACALVFAVVLYAARKCARGCRRRSDFRAVTISGGNPMASGLCAQPSNAFQRSER